MSNYFTLMSGTPRHEVAYAATMLRDASHDWWTAYLRQRGGLMLLDSASFELDLWIDLEVNMGQVGPN